MMRAARKELGLATDETIMIGDTMETDILGGVQLGLPHGPGPQRRHAIRRLAAIRLSARSWSWSRSANSPICSIATTGGRPGAHGPRREHGP